MLISDENIEIKFTMRNQKVSHILILSDPSDPLANTAKEKHYQTSNSCLPTLPPCLIAETKGTNGWSHPPVDIFHVRGPTYLDDKKKVVSGPYLLTARGCDLFLTKDAPANIGSNSNILGGELRRVPTFIINFRFPWGVLVLYFEIPQKYCPFLNSNANPPTMDGLSPSEKSLCRFFMADQEQKNNTLKLVPYVAEGPWIVRSLVTGTPTIIGKKLPVSYHYEPADKNSGNAEYLEADLDVGNSTATAKRIVSLCRKYMNTLTLDIGFVIQGNTDDELPEQMLCSIRVHGPDALQAPNLN